MSTYYLDQCVFKMRIWNMSPFYDSLHQDSDLQTLFQN